MENINHGENEIFRQRKDKLLRLLNEEHYNPYLVEKFEVLNTLEDIESKYSYLKPNQELKEETIQTAGRIITIRKHGKLTFIDLMDETFKLQICFTFNLLGKEKYNFFKKWIDNGDWVGMLGYPCKMQKGELTILVTDYKLLSKAIRSLPEKWHSLTDIETRYRQRYLDLIANPENKDIFRKRSKIISSFRQTLEYHNTLEVETPILSTLAGGANAKPFITHHNALDTDMYMRIAIELYLKRLVVGMMGRVYEIGKNFRNEGIDIMHNPEFTMMEIYWPYSDYIDMMNLAEELIRNAANSINTNIITWNKISIDLSKPFRRITMREIVKEITNVDIDAIETDEKARNIGKEKGLILNGNEGKYTILNMLFETYCEDKLIEPTFLIGHPVEISPLAKRDPDNPNYTHRFELFMFGKEVANAFSELNDPIDQRKRFEDQLKKRNAGDEEAHRFDEDFINAIETGLPPTGGMGIGIDRIVMFLTGSPSIRDVILFPTMKPKI